jgi:hypothetical protein
LWLSNEFDPPSQSIPLTWPINSMVTYCRRQSLPDPDKGLFLKYNLLCLLLRSDGFAHRILHVFRRWPAVGVALACLTLWFLHLPCITFRGFENCITGLRLYQWWKQLFRGDLCSCKFRCQPCRTLFLCRDKSLTHLRRLPEEASLFSASFGVMSIS